MRGEPVMSSSFPRARVIFDAAVELPPAERARLVQEACGDDASLRATVEQMLRANGESHAVLDGTPPLHVDRWHAGDSFAGHYRIAGLIGRGGMGEVYRAQDTTLGRDVALKVLPSSVAIDSAVLDDRLARFQREAQVLAVLNHPNIATIHGFENAAGVRALVLELVDGPTLADRIATGRLPLDEAVSIARQIAVGLEAAHDLGVVHRDLKPANIKLRTDGTVKLLDFGLAKIVESGRVADGSATSSPTITGRSSIEAGVLLGTAAYMSPEQAKGREADRRSDVWSFGAVLYEMLAGTRAFKGNDIADTHAAVLRAEVDWGALPVSIPAPIRRLLARCLDRDTKRRLRDIGEARIVLEDAQSAPGDEPTYQSRRAPSIAIAGIAIALAAAAAWYLKPAAPGEVTRLALMLPETLTLSSGDRSVAAISPDGAKVAFVASPPAVYLRLLSTGTTNPIRGTDGLGNLGEPVFSPDSDSLVFHASADGTLKRIPVGGGVAETLCAANFPYGMSWGEDGICSSNQARASCV
jgi:serine/threonine-protein kinase